jgi:hypothetical protein
MQFIFSAGYHIRKMSRELRFTDVVYPDAELKVTGLDVDSALSMVYWSTGNIYFIFLLISMNLRRCFITIAFELCFRICY